jgi:hypothetical protein
MPKIKTDDEMRSEFMPRVKAFIDERLMPRNSQQIYDCLKPYHYDTSGWLLYGAAKGILQADVYSEFPAEDNKSFFEALDGYGLLKWLEAAKFADREHEKLTDAALDTNTPEYKEYQGKLYAAAIRSIAIGLADKQPYLLEGFLNRLLYVENILERGYPTRDGLNEKLNREADNLADASREVAEGQQYSEYGAKRLIYKGLRETAMTDEMVQALFVTDGALDKAYRFYTDECKDEQIHLAVWQFLDKAEHDYLAARVFDRVKLAYDDFVDRVMDKAPSEIVDAAYRLSMMNDICISLEPKTSEYSTEQLKALMSLPEPLSYLFAEWQSRDYTLMDEIKEVITETANELAAEIEEQSFESEDEEEAEDGLEP